ncbi:protein FAM180A isoform X2 [Silurus meridionalis]|uniref:protein FAM180A isoform X2 n=1 Tax=Silurus meridionalis TaxID=175797 RepID=UPI001EEC4EA0|nr:protein FAM180A isoform X2 [Silurus meridionalis]
MITRFSPYTSTTHTHRPDALAVSQVRSPTSSTLITTVSDANLIYEFLLRGLVIDEDNNVGIRDQEMASMKQGRVFLSLINDDIPKTVLAMEELLVMLEEEEQSFNQGNFETLLLGIIYSAYQVQDKRQENQQQAWASVLGRLANVTLVQLRRS